MRFFSKRRYSGGEINPDEIFLDSKNIPAFDTHQFEGRIERPISKRAMLFTGLFFLVLIGTFVSRVFYLEIVNGEEYLLWSQRNHLRHSPVFSDRGVITDRNGELLAWNVVSSSTLDFAARRYITEPGFAHLVGYVKYPSVDSSGFYYKEETSGVDGVEKAYDELLRGTNGIRIIEVNARGGIESANIISPPVSGTNLSLSIDARVQKKLYETIKATASEVGFSAGSGIIMDVSSGELLAVASYPEYPAQVMTDGSDTKQINRLLVDERKPFLNRAILGLYTPGSIMKPFVALGALEEGIIDPEKQILSTGSISIPNPFDETKKSVFTDWKAHGYVDMRRALAVSSNVYFYEIGGGFESQTGLGISRIEEYFRMFGFGKEIPGNELVAGKAGTIPNPQWKEDNFDGEEWRVGDTYNTSIGQYGVQVTPIQAVRAIAAIANGGELVTPTVVKRETEGVSDAIVLPVSPSNIEIIQEGMRHAVTEGTAQGLSIPSVEVAAKTGTAELGVTKQSVNSWIVGFFPYDAPRYAFAVTMEKGRRDNLIGGLYVMRQLLEWMSADVPEYLSAQSSL